MSLPIYQRVAVTDAGDVIPGAEYTVINENTGVAAPIYSDRTGATLLSAPYFADSVGTIQFFIAQGTTFRVAASGGVGTYTDRYVYGVAEAVLVQADGNVGIGTSSPSGLLKTLNIDGGAGGSSIALDGGDNFSVVYTGATAGDPTSVFSNTGFKFATATAKDATGFSEKMRIESSGNVTVSANINLSANDTYVGFPSNGIYYNNSSDHISVKTGAAERLRIENSGNLALGTTSSGSARLRVVGDTSFVCYFSNSSGTGVYLPPGGTSWVVASDERIKDIIEPISDAMSKLSTLRTVMGKYKVDPDGTRRPFLIAQDVQAVFPEVVNKQDDEDGTLGVEYTSLIPAMIAGMKEQQTLIEALTARITALEAK